MIYISSNCLSWVKTTGTCFLIRRVSKAFVFVRFYEELTRGPISAKKKNDKESESKRLAMNADYISLYNWDETKGECCDRAELTCHIL